MATRNNARQLAVSRRHSMRGQKRRGGNGGAGQQPHFSRLVMILVLLGALGLAGVMVTAGAGIIVYHSYADDLVPPDELAINKPSYGAKILDRNGNLLYEYVDDQSGLRRPVPLASVSPAFLAATISTEDSSFFTNPGINITGLGRAAWNNFSPIASDTPGFLSSGGGSSITQQLVKNVYIAPEERQKRSVSRKIKETVFALELTQRYSKDKILEWYVNQISYGGVYNGVEAASEGYFGKPANELSLAEAALLAGIPQSPAAYDPVNNVDAAFERRNEVLDLLLRKGRIQIGENQFFDANAEAIAAAKQELINIAPKRFPIEAPHFVLQYIQPQLETIYGHDALYRDGLVVTTTLDLNLQHEANAILEKYVAQYEVQSGSHNGAVMVMNPKTDEILVMVGSRDYFRDDIQGKNNNATSCNSPGSSFKPFAYITAFLNLGWGPGTVLLDTPVEFANGTSEPFVPTNPNRDFKGPVTIRSALGNSLNIPANKAAAAVGADKIVAQARKMGFLETFRLKSEGGCSGGGGYGPAIATGGVDVTLENMMVGYSVLASAGVMGGQESAHRSTERQLDPISILKVTDSSGAVRFDVDKLRKQQRIVPAEYTYLISNILSDGSSQCATFGCGGITIPGYGAAVKTGTSSPFEAGSGPITKIGETWAFGYTPDIVVGVWAGNSDNTPVLNIFSTTMAFPIMRDTLVASYAGKTASALQRPAGVVEGTVCVPSGLKVTPLCDKTTTDLFVKDALPTKDDEWWQLVKIDTRNNLLASPTTPLRYIVESKMLIIPAGAVQGTSEEWADALKLPVPPKEVSTLPPEAGGSNQPGDTTGQGGLPPPNLSLAQITFPRGGTIAGTLQVRGTAAIPNFQLYRLEFGMGANPTTWNQLAQLTTPVLAGTLGSWSTGGLAPGIYTLRLTVQDRTGRTITDTTSVVVSASGPVTTTPTP